MKNMREVLKDIEERSRSSNSLKEELLRHNKEKQKGQIKRGH